MLTAPTKEEFPDFSGRPEIMEWQDILWRKQSVLIDAASKNDAETIRRLDDGSVLNALELCTTYMTNAIARAEWSRVKAWSLRAARLAAAKEEGR